MNLRIVWVKGIGMLEGPAPIELMKAQRWRYCSRTCEGCQACTAGMPRGHWWTSIERKIAELVKAARAASIAIEIGDDELRERIEREIEAAAAQRKLFE